MRTLLARVAALVLALAMAAHTVSAYLELEEPMMIECGDGMPITLRVAARDVLFGVNDGTGTSPTVQSFMMRTRVYEVDGVATPPEGYFPAPTISMNANERCEITIINDLDLDGEAGCEAMGHHENDFHCPNVTTLHTHGLHVSPFDDNINSFVPPGSALTYNYSMPMAHLPGTHWYHAHRHGSTTLQVTGGMAGVLQVKAAAGTPVADSSVYNTFYSDPTFANTHTMMLMHHFMGPGDAGGGGFTMESHTEIWDRFSSRYPDMMEEFAPPNYAAGESPAVDFYSVNNMISPRISVKDASTHLLRMVHVGSWRVLILDHDAAASGSSCELRLVARDGVFQQAYSAGEDDFVAINRIVMVQGTRADVAVTCTGPVGSVITFSAVEGGVGFPLGDQQNQHIQADVFALVIAEAAGPGPAPVTNGDFGTMFPSYLSDLQSVTAEAPLSATDAEPGTGYPVVRFTGGADPGINGIPFPGIDGTPYVAEFCRDTVYEMLLAGGGGGGGAGPAHPFHQHVNHFQVVEVPDASWVPDITRLGEWRDVMPAANIRVRFPTADFVGGIITHCHILEHEDGGMMGQFMIHECCATNSDCASPCGKTAACTAGRCVYEYEDEGTACLSPVGGLGACSWYGECIDFCDFKSCDDNNVCTEDVCQHDDGQCLNIPIDDMCSGATPHCSPTVDGAGEPTGAHSCVECLDSDDCASGEYCGDDNTCQSGCSVDADCTDATLPYCHDAQCRACTLDTHCAGALVCSGDSECVECNSNADCAGDVCRSDGTCVQCNTDADCGGTDVCDAANSCVSAGSCGADADCPGQYCGATLECVDCTMHAHCSGGDVCRNDGTCVQCNTNADCGGTDVCDATNVCVSPSGSCGADADCPSGQYCGATLECVDCTMHAHCSGGDVCRNDGTCVQCNTNADCGGTDVCDATNVCVSPSGGCSSSDDCNPGEFCNDDLVCEATPTCSNNDDLFIYDDGNGPARVATSDCNSHRSPSECAALPKVTWGTPGTAGFVEYWILGEAGDGLEQCMPPQGGL